MSDVFEFIETFPEGSPHREYYEAVWKILLGITFDRSDVDLGRALIECLAIPQFTGVEHNFLNDGVSGSRWAAAQLIAVLFCEGSHDSDWWLGKHPQLKRPLYDWWVEQFRKSPLVRDAW